MSRIRILVVESQRLRRRALCVMLSTHVDIEVFGEARSLEEACEQVAAKSPDIITIDFQLGSDNGQELQQQLEVLRKRGKTIPKVLLLTQHEDARHIRVAMKSEVAGYVATSASEEEFIAAIRSVHAGHFVLHTSSSPVFEASDCAVQTESVLDQLSERELDVLHGVASGHTNKAIAARLGLSVKTVESYRARLCSKLHISSRPELLKFSLRHGLLSVSDLVEPSGN